MENGLLHITAEITLGKFQEPLLHLENKLESGQMCIRDRDCDVRLLDHKPTPDEMLPPDPKPTGWRRFVTCLLYTSRCV